MEDAFAGFHSFMVSKLVVENFSDFVVQLHITHHKQFSPLVELSHEGSRIYILFKNVPL